MGRRIEVSSKHETSIAAIGAGAANSHYVRPAQRTSMQAAAKGPFPPFMSIVTSGPKLPFAGIVDAAVRLPNAVID
ncbi:MAG: hypothetical protein ACI82I_003099 [Gammaproteobacteria bacterium]|jgi:hypothetical protein